MSADESVVYRGGGRLQAGFRYKQDAPHCSLLTAHCDIVFCIPASSSSFNDWMVIKTIWSWATNIDATNLVIYHVYLLFNFDECLVPQTVFLPHFPFFSSQ